MDPIDNKRFQKLIHFYSLINSEIQDSKELLSQIIEAAASLVGGDSASLLLLDSKKETLTFEIALGEKGHMVKNLTLSIDEGIAGWVARHNRSLLVEDTSRDKRFFSEIDQKVGYHSQSILAVPLRLKEDCIGVLEVISDLQQSPFSSDDLEWLEIFSTQASLAIDNARMFQQFRSQVQGKGERQVISRSKGMKALMALVHKVAQSDAPVLITGESGTGKELLAGQIHEQSLRSEGPLVPVNCAAIPEELVEMEFFGYVKGAFTGADKNHRGKFEQANGGTLFLDEVGELSMDAQSKILRVLETRIVEKVGDTNQIPIDIRILSATNRNLEEEIRKGNFRRDLYYRLHVLPLKIPALRERPEDILPLAEKFLNHFQKQLNRQGRFTPASVEALLSYQWPGNVRELQNTVERALIVSRPEGILPEDLGLNDRIDKTSEKYKDKTLKEAVNAFKKNYLEHVLETKGGNQTEASKALGIQRTYLSRLIKEFKL